MNRLEIKIAQLEKDKAKLLKENRRHKNLWLQATDYVDKLYKNRKTK